MERSPHIRNVQRGTRLAGLHRGSCSWLDAVGPGYAVGVSSRLVNHATSAAGRGYCR